MNEEVEAQQREPPIRGFNPDLHGQHGTKIMIFGDILKLEGMGWQCEYSLILYPAWMKISSMVSRNRSSRMGSLHMDTHEHWLMWSSKNGHSVKQL